MTALNHGTHQLDSVFSICYYFKDGGFIIARRSKWNILFCNTDNLTLMVSFFFFLMLIELSIQPSENNTKLLKEKKTKTNP